MSKTEIRKATEKDVEHFVDLYLMHSGDFFASVFGKYNKKFLEQIFPKRRTFFSYENTFIAEVDGKVAGMALCNIPDHHEEERSRLQIFITKYMNWRILFRFFPMLKGAKAGVFKFGEKDIYLHSMAVYPEYKDYGIDQHLLDSIEEFAQDKNLERAVFAAEKENVEIQGLMQKYGFVFDQKVSKLKLRGKDYAFQRMVKEI
jgi:ribosomal protein S18 acetylase RimI-like enzyme